MKVTENNIYIEDSYKVKKEDFESYFINAFTINPDCKVLRKRTYFSLKMEWTVHNFLYNVHILRGRTGSVDLNYPNKYEWAYKIFGVLTWLLIK